MRAALKALRSRVAMAVYSADVLAFKLIWKATMATWIKCTNMKHEVVYKPRGDCDTERNDVAERGNCDQVYIVVNEQPEETVALIPR
jgi:hypothetical protein